MDILETEFFFEDKLQSYEVLVDILQDYQEWKGGTELIIGSRWHIETSTREM